MWILGLKRLIALPYTYKIFQNRFGNNFFFHRLLHEDEIRREEIGEDGKLICCAL